MVAGGGGGGRDRGARAAQPATIRDEFLRFATFSSIRGVPRSLKSRSIGWSLLWALSVVGFLSVSGVFVVRLILQFADYNTFYEIDNEFQSKNAPFPSVTICNLQPFSSSLLDRIFAASPILGVSADSVSARFEELQSLAGGPEQQLLTWKSFFLQNWAHLLGPDSVLRFEDFVLNGTCKFKHTGSSRLTARACSPAEDVMVLFSSRYLTCFTITPPWDVSNSTRSLEMDLYLDTETSLSNGSGSRQQLFTLEDSVGAFVAVHSPRTYPDVDHGVHVHPGTKSVVEIVTTKLDKQLEDFFRTPCTKRQTQRLVSSQGASVDFSYKTTVCMDVSTQRKIARRCFCVDPDLPVPQELQSLPFCGQMPAGAFNGSGDAAVGETATRLNCAMSIELNADRDAALTECPLSCQYISYTTTAYQSLWPPRSNEMEFYRKHVQNRSEFGSKFAAYDAADASIRAGNVTEGLALLQTAGDLIRGNFLRLYIFRPDLSLTISQQKFQISPEALISQIGGAFSLWAGLTVITLVEFLELGYYVLKRLLLGLLGGSHRMSGAGQAAGQVAMDNKDPHFTNLGCSIDESG